MSRPLLRPGCLACLLLLIGAGCTPARVPPVGLPPVVPIPKDQVASVLGEREGAIRSVKGLAKVRVVRRGEARTLEEAALISPPNHLRLETLAFGGAPVAILVMDGEVLALHALSRKEFIVAPARRHALEALSGLPVQPGQLLRLLAGLPPLEVRPADPRLLVQAEGPGYAVDSVEGRYRQELSVTGGGTIAAGKLWEVDQLLLTFRFDDLRETGGVPFPHRILVEVPGEAASVQVTYQSVQLNAPIPPEMFRLERPTDPETRFLELDGARLPR